MNHAPFIPRSSVSLAPGDIHLWLVDKKDVMRANVIQHYSTLLSDDEKQRMLTFRSSDRQRQFLIARAALRSLLSLYIPGHTPESLRFEKNTHGKPMLSENVQDLQFNLSHSQNHVLIGVTKKRMLGVDIECMHNGRNVRKIAEHYFHPSEWNASLLQEDASQQRDAAFRFYRLWTLKEAFIKAQGKGWVIPIDAFYFQDNDASQPELVVTEPEFRSAKQWGFEHQFLSDGYSMAVAFERDDHLSSVYTQLRRYVPLADAGHQALT